MHCSHLLHIFLNQWIFQVLFSLFETYILFHSLSCSFVLFYFHSWTDLVFPRGLVLHNGPGLSVIAVSHFEGCDKLDGAKVFGPLCDDSCDLLGSMQIHLRTQKQRCFINAAVDKLKTMCSSAMSSSPTCSHSDWLLVAAVQALVLPCLSSRA